MSHSSEDAVSAHYSRPDLLDAILAGLDASGADLNALKPEDLAPVDEFHTAGRSATLKALELADFAPNSRIIDVGSGIGGTARHLAFEHGHHVTGVDLTPDYVATARDLSARMGLSSKCTFVHGSATDIPFPDNAFDGAVTFHAAMNIADRPKLYSEVARVLKPGGNLCLFDVMKGPEPGMLYPVPWAETEETSHLKSRDETHAHLTGAGLESVAEENLRDFAMEFFKAIFAKAAESDGPPPLGLHLLTGANTQVKFSNYVEALTAHQIEPVIMVARKT